MEPDSRKVNNMPISSQFTVVGLGYVSLYVMDPDAAVRFYSRVFGEPGYVGPDPPTYGWRMGATWLTVFSAQDGPHPGADPRGTEFAVQVSAPQQVDRLYAALIEAGARPCMPPRDHVRADAIRLRGRPVRRPHPRLLPAGGDRQPGIYSLKLPGSSVLMLCGPMVLRQRPPSGPP